MSTPTVNVTKRQGGGFEVQASITLPKCTAEKAFRLVSDFRSHPTWNSGLQDMRVTDSTAAPGQAILDTVQQISFLKFKGTYSTRFAAVADADQRSVQINMIDSGLYNHQTSSFKIEDEDTHSARVQYTGSFHMKFGPPGPLNGIIIPRALRSSITDMLTNLQSTTETTASA